MTTLSGKTALVTGSTSGIGLGIALSLAKAGANLILNGFGDASRIIAEVEQFGGKVGHHPADVSDPVQIAEMIEYAEREFGGVDILVNNAGIQHVASVEDFSGGALGLDHCDQPVVRVSQHPLEFAGDARQGLGTDHQHRLGAWPGRFGGQGGVRRGQAWSDRFDQGGRLGNRYDERHLQCHLPGLGADAAGAEADR